MDTEEYYGGTYPEPPEYEEKESDYEHEWDLADEYCDEKGIEEYLEQLEKENNQKNGEIKIEILKMSDWNFKENKKIKTIKDIIEILKKYDSPIILYLPQHIYTKKEKIEECDYDISITIFDSGFLES